MKARILGILLVLGTAAFGQSVTLPGGDQNAPPIQVTPHIIPPGVQTGLPYSADQVTDHTQTLANGTRTTDKQVVLLWRDSLGRTRTERPVPGSNDSSGPTTIEIDDPIAGFHYVLDPSAKVVHRFPAHTGSPQPQLPAGLGTTPVGTVVDSSGRQIGEISAGIVLSPATPVAGPRATSQDLGTQVIEGVSAQGTRTVTTWPAGSRGNDQPMTDTSESWYSQELKSTVLSKSASARNGETVTKLTNIRRGEPDPNLFQLPRDYTVVDETGRR